MEDDGRRDSTASAPDNARATWPMKPAKSMYNLTEVKTRRFPWSSASRRWRRSSAEMDYAMDAAHLARRSADDTPDDGSFSKKSGRSLLSDIQALLAHAESQATRLAALEAKVEAQLPNVADGVGRLEERLQLVSVRVDEQSVLARKHGAQVSDVDRSLTRLGAKVKEMGGGGGGGPGGGRGALGGTHHILLVCSLLTASRQILSRGTSYRAALAPRFRLSLGGGGGLLLLHEQ